MSEKEEELERFADLLYQLAKQLKRFGDYTVGWAIDPKEVKSKEGKDK